MASTVPRPGKLSSFYSLAFLLNPLFPKHHPMNITTTHQVPVIFAQDLNVKGSLPPWQSTTLFPEQASLGTSASWRCPFLVHARRRVVATLSGLKKGCSPEPVCIGAGVDLESPTTADTKPGTGAWDLVCPVEPPTSAISHMFARCRSAL